jgi:hypothetical protein
MYERGTTEISSSFVLLSLADFPIEGMHIDLGPFHLIKGILFTGVYQ